MTLVNISPPSPGLSTGISRKGGCAAKSLHFPGRGPLIDHIPVDIFFQEQKISHKKKWCTFFEKTGYRDSLLETVTGNSNNLIPRVFKLKGTSMTVIAICQPMVLVLGCGSSKKYFSWCPRRPHPLRRSDVAKYRMSQVTLSQTGPCHERGFVVHVNVVAFLVNVRNS